MKTKLAPLGTVGLLFLTPHLHCATFYVNVSNTVPALPFTDWAIAATNIQDQSNWSRMKIP